MAKVILSSKFIKTPSNKNIGRLVRYIGTREGVEKVAKGKDNAPATKQQQELIFKAIESYLPSWDYPELKRYFDNPTKANATEFLNTFYERNEDKVDGVKKLMNYYAERPSVEKIGTHGLFSETDDKIDLDKVADEVANHNGVVWTHVVSLKREDGERLGYNNAKAWQELVRRNVYELAEAHKIEPSDLQWYGAFHNTTHHPHMHLVVYSKSGKGYLTENGILKLKSAFGNDIFRNEQYKLFKMQTDLRNKLQDEAKEYLNNLVQKSNDYEPSEKAEKLYQKLIEQLKTVKGKKVYGYLPKNVKQTVDDIVREISKDENITKLNVEWNRINREKLSLYHDKETPDIPLVENKELRNIKNSVISMAKYSNKVIPAIGSIIASDIKSSCLKKHEALRKQYSGNEIQPLITDLSSLLKAVSRITENPAEDEEERRKRIEAEENAEAIGTILGTAIGLTAEAISSAKARREQEIEEQLSQYEQKQYYEEPYYESEYDDYDEDEDVGFGLSM
ncbi:MAG: MobP3 family relaxase [Ruminococcus sp.]|nr:MobP3 family relaxase [Ruminococcus sp.]